MEKKNTMSATVKVFNTPTISGETALRRMIARNSRSISRVTKGHLSPVVGEEHIWSIARTPELAYVVDLECILRNSDEAKRMTINSHLAIRRARTDRKREKVRATASRNEKIKMRKKDGYDNSCRIRCKTYCSKYGRPKVLFDTYEAAERYIAYENVLNRAESGRLFAYYCENCHGWHISSWEKYRCLAT